MLGLGAALHADHTVDGILFGAVLLGAVLAHLSVNLLNEYADFRSGLDFKTQKTPFSGGSGALVADPSAARAVLAVGLFALLLVVALGFYIIQQRGLIILPIGLVGVLIVLAYTPWINRDPWLCLIVPGLGFGPLMVGGTYVTLTGHYSVAPFVISLVPFFLANNLLLLNQYPDIEADRNVGRKHIPIVYGIQYSNRVYAIFTWMTALVIGAAVVAGILPGTGLLAMLPLLLSFWVAVRIRGYQGNVAALVPSLGLNVAAVVLTPLVLAIALVFG